VIALNSPATGFAATARLVEYDDPNKPNPCRFFGEITPIAGSG
jgi:hypothetical protein